MDERWQKITIKEIMIWTAIAAFVFASPSWAGRSALMFFFYVTLLAVAWRLSHFIHVGCAVFIGILLAIAVTVGFVQMGVL